MSYVSQCVKRRLISHNMQKVETWFNNRTQQKKGRVPMKLKRNWTGERVFEFIERSSISAERDDSTAPQHGLVKWNVARSALWKNVSPEAREAFEETAVQWNRGGPDAEYLPMYVKSVFPLGAPG